jgi:hypothetical protein
MKEKLLAIVFLDNIDGMTLAEFISGIERYISTGQEFIRTYHKDGREFIEIIRPETELEYRRRKVKEAEEKLKKEIEYLGALLDEDRKDT